MAYIISSANTKGGTGKTTLLKHLGIVLVEKKKRVLLIDLCQNSDVATRLGYDRYSFKYDTYDWISKQVPFDRVVQHDDETGIDFIPASAQVDKIMEYAAQTRVINQEWILAEAIKEIEDQYDYIMIDNHPSETTKMLTYSLVASHMVLVPIQMDISAVIAGIRSITIVKKLNEQGVKVAHAVVPMAVDFSKGFGKELETIKVQFAGLDIHNFLHPIRYSAVVMRAGLNNEVLPLNNPYMQKVMEDYRVLGEELIKKTVGVGEGVLNGD